MNKYSLTSQNNQALRALALSFLLALLLSCRHSATTTILPYRETQVEKSDIEVEDGDTFNWRNQPVRMLGIDCPETKSPHHSGDQEPWGGRAREYLEAQVAAAKSLSIIRTDKPDRYGRWLGYLLADGENVNAKIIGQGLAYETISKYGKQKLDKYAEEVLKAARNAPKPQFENPSDFRKRNRKE
ncbi:thermonuclease family protein [bacterium]|nr:thermonuclease family protein [bacterium]